MSEWKKYRLKDICARLSSGKNIPAVNVSDEGFILYMAEMGCGDIQTYLTLKVTAR